MTMATLVYSAVATNLAGVDLATKLGAVPLEPNLVDPELVGLTLTSDTATNTGNNVTRTIVYTLPAPPEPLFPDSTIADLLTNFYTAIFSKALATPIVAAAVVIT